MEGVTKEDEDELFCGFVVNNDDGQNTNVFCTVVDVDMIVRDDDDNELLDESAMVIDGGGDVKVPTLYVLFI